MEIIIDVIKALLTFAGVFLAARYGFKGKQLEVASAHDKALENMQASNAKALMDMQTKHSENLDKTKGEFNARLDVIGIKLDDIKTEQIKIALTVTQLQKELSKSNETVDGLTDRVTDLEGRMSGFEAEQKSINHRLDLLEKK